MCNFQYRPHYMNIQARITLNVACIRGYILIVLCYVPIQGRVRSRLTCIFDVTDSQVRSDLHSLATLAYSAQVGTHSERGGGAGPPFVREIGVCYDTCWWYSLCTFQYRQHYEHTCSYNFECGMYTRIYFDLFV